MQEAQRRYETERAEPRAGLRRLCGLTASLSLLLGFFDDEARVQGVDVRDAGSEIALGQEPNIAVGLRLK